jgi:hypothetical protein
MAAHKVKAITIEYTDGNKGVFEPQEDGSWHQTISGMRVTGYDGPNVMRVLAAQVGTKEIAD